MKNMKKIIAILLMLSMVFQLGGFNGEGAAFAEDAEPQQRTVKLSDIKLSKWETQEEFPDQDNVVLSISNAFWVSFSWDASEYENTLKEGDYFLVYLPDAFNYYGNVSEFDLSDETGKVLAKAAYDKADRVVKAVFTDEVANKYNVKGTMMFGLSIERRKIDDDQEKLLLQLDTVHPFENPIEKEITLKWPNPINENHVLSKWSKNDYKDGAVGWEVMINHRKGALAGATFIDTLGVKEGDVITGVGYVKDSFILREVKMDKYGWIDEVVNYTTLEEGNHDWYDLTFTGGEGTPPSFTLKFIGESHNGKQYRLSYQTTYPFQTQPRLNNSVTVIGVETPSHGLPQSATYSYMEASGTASGVYKNRIKVTKIDKVTSDAIKGVEFQIIDSSGVVVETITTNEWGIAVSKVYTAGNTYTVKETKAAPGYQTPTFEQEVMITDKGELVTVYNDPLKRDIDVTKKWDGDALDSVEVKLMLGGGVVKTVELNAAMNWQYTFADLKKYKTGTTDELQYTVEEVVPEGYTAKVSGDMAAGFVITNTKDSTETVTTTTTTAATTPDSADEETTTAGGTTAETTTESPAEDTTAASADVTAATTTTTAAAGDLGGGDVADSLVEVTVSKIWDGEAQSKVVVYLLAEGVIIDTIELNEGNGWQHTFANLPEYNGTAKIRYSIGEQAMKGYAARIAILSPGVYEITNTKLDTEITEGEELEIWFSEDTPLGGVDSPDLSSETGGATMPYTASLPSEFFYGVGLFVAALGVALRASKK